MYLSFTHCSNCPDSLQVSKLALSQLHLKLKHGFCTPRCIRFSVAQYEWADENKTSLLGGSNLVIHSTAVLVSENTKGSYAYKM